MSAPLIVTERLALRAMVAGDFPAYRDMMASDRARFMGGPFTEAAAWGLFCHDHAGWSLFGLGALMIDKRRTGETIGQVGINRGPLFPETELGWTLYDGHEWHGYATEAAAGLRDWALAEGRLTTLVSYTHPGNHASQAVARRLGAVIDPDAPRQDPEDVVFRHPIAAEAAA